MLRIVSLAVGTLNTMTETMAFLTGEDCTERLWFFPTWYNWPQ